MWRPRAWSCFEISAAAHQGTRELVKRAAQELQQLPPVVVYEPTYVERPPRWTPTASVSHREVRRHLGGGGPLAPAADCQRQLLGISSPATGLTRSCASPVCSTNWRRWASRTEISSPCMTWSSSTRDNRRQLSQSPLSLSPYRFLPHTSLRERRRVCLRWHTLLFFVLEVAQSANLWA